MNLVHWGLKGALAWKDSQPSNKQTCTTAMQTGSGRKTGKRQLVTGFVASEWLDVYRKHVTLSVTHYRMSFMLKRYLFLYKYKGLFSETNRQG